jgi:hypothetical protein
VDAYATSAEADKTDYADDMIKEIVDEQVGSSASETGRNRISVAADLSAASSFSKAFAWRNVLRTCQEIAEQANQNDEYLAFDVVRTNIAEFELRTYTGQRGRDHSRDSNDPRLVSRKTGNLFEASFGTSHSNERNYIVVGGKGEETARTIVDRSDTTRINSSQWNRRERFEDGRNAGTTTAALNSIGDAALDEFKPKQILTGTLKDTTGMKYGIHYGFGDLLTAEAFGYAVDVHVSGVKVTVDQDGGEQIDIKLRGEL